MSKRSAKFVPALFAGILAGASLAAVTDLRAQTTQAQATKPPADNCLAAPGSTTPAGGHWYYRIDRATKRKCWYLREENDQANDKSARAAPQDSPPTSAAAAEPAPPPTTITRKAIADARAEWISQQARTEQNFPANVEPPATGAVAAPPVEDSQRAAMPNVLAPTPLAETRWPETRWPEPSAVSSSSNPTDVRAAASNPPSDQPEQAAEMQQPAAAPAAPAAVPVAPAAVEPSTAKPTASLQMLLLVMAAALALAGITVSLVMRFGRARARAVMRRNRRAIWDEAQANTRRSSRSVHPGEEARIRRTAEGVHHPRATENRERQVNRDRQVSDALARLARSAQT